MIKLRKKKTLSFILIFTFILNVFSSLFTSTVKAEEDKIDFILEKLVDRSEVYAGEEFTYTIKYSNPNTTTDAHNVVIVDELPDNIRYVDSIPSTDIESTDIGKRDGHDVVTFKFKEPLKAGVTGFVKIIAKFPEGVTRATINGNPNIAENTAIIKGDNGNEVKSNKVIVTPKEKSPDWTIKKTRIIPAAVNPVVGYPVTYRIDVNGNSVIGGLNLHDVKIIDTIPPNSQYISSSNGGVYDNGKVTWDIGEIPVGASRSRTITVMYPSDKFSKASTVTNTAIGFVKVIGSDEELSKTTVATHGFDEPILGVGSFAKFGRQDNDRYSVGQTARFGLGRIQNTGNVPFDKIEITDVIPKEIKVTSISTGLYSNSVKLEVKYKTDKNDWRDWKAIEDLTSSQWLNVKDLPLNSDETITEIKWILTNGTDGIPAGFKDTESISLNGTVSMPATGNKITNNATLIATATGNPDIVKPASKDIFVIDPMPWLVPEKTVKNGQVKFNMNDTVEYNLRIKNHDFATGDFINPIAIDVLPIEMENPQILGWDKGNSSITSEPVVDISQTVEIGGKTHQLLKWNFTGDLKPGEYVDVKFSAKIKDKTLTGKLVNKLYITTNDQSVFENPSGELIGDTYGLDGGAKYKNSLVLASKDIFINFIGSIDAQKWVKGELDSDWGYYGIDDGYGKTLPGGIADYRLKIKNTGANGPISNLVFIDVLPYVGDTGVIDSKARNSAWRPYLVNKITGENGAPLPVGVKVYYSTNPNPSKGELSNPITNKGLPGDGWSENLPADITTVRALKFDFGAIELQPEEEITLEWPMRAPYEAPRSKIAWNSFGYGATYMDSDGPQSFLPSEPKKVGFEVQSDPASRYYIGNFVWEDMNKNGIQDPEDSGINGILVNLYSAGDMSTPIKYTRTGDNHKTGKPGYYEFPNLEPGHYVVEFVYPKNYKATPYKVGTDIELDSNIDGTKSKDYLDIGVTKSSIKTEEIILNDKDDFSIDAGLYRLASIGDRVWNDQNANGIQNSGEKGIEGVTVTLLDKDGNPARYGNGLEVFPTNTDVNGNYKFENLEPGEYKVKFINPNGDYKFTKVNALGSNKDTDSDAKPEIDEASATTPTATFLKSGENNMSIDAGMYLAQIGDIVWHDKDSDGIQELGEPGVAGVTVKLTDKNGAVVKDKYDKDIKPIITDGNGKYLFDNLKPGEYIVEFVKPVGYDKFTKKTQGTDNTKDSDGDKTTGKTDVIKIAAGERNMNIDQGLYKLASVGDFVWSDKNANGIQDSGEVGIKDVIVKLLDKDGNPGKYEDGTLVPPTATDKNGKYLFQGLEPGIYKIELTNPDDSYNFSDPKQGSDNSKDSDAIVGADKSVATSAEVTLNSGDVNLSVDAGLHKALLGDTLWHDMNGNGIQDSGEVGIQGAKVELLDKDEKPLKDGSNNPITSITDALGKYEFNNLEAGEYKVKFILPDGYYFSPKNSVGSTADNDSDVDATTGITDVITLEKGQIDRRWDAGAYKAASLGDFVWFDKNGNGSQDAGEPGIQGVTVRLLDSKGNPVKSSDGKDLVVVTDSAGKYNFTKLMPGTYIVKFENLSYYKATEATQGSDTGKDSNADKATGEATVTLKSGDNDITIDAGYVLNANIRLDKTVYAGHNGGKGTGLENVKGERGTPITYLFTVTNIGTSYLNNIVINDITLGINTSNMTKLSGTELLEPGEKLIYYYETTISNDMTNEATVEGTPSDKTGDKIPNSDKVSWKDIAVIGELIPKIEIQKTVYAGHDGGAQTGGELVVGEKGTPVTYVFKIKNTGNVYLKDIVVDDLNLAIDKSKITKISGNEPLAPGGELVYYYESAIDKSLTNLVKTEGTPSDSTGNDIPLVSKPSAQDTAAVQMVSPAITVEKTVYNGHDGGKGKGSKIVSGKIGSDVTYVFTVKNTGDTYLKDIVINDTTLGISKSEMTKISGNEPLAPGESIVYYYDGNKAKINNDLTNTVIVDGIPCDNSGSPVPNTTKPTASDKADVKVSASVGDYVWHDINGDGKQDPSEKGIPKVKLLLKDLKGNILTTTTDSNGKYLFDDLMPGDYELSIDTKTIPAGMIASYELDSTLDSKVAVTLASGQFKEDVDFGYYTPSPSIRLASVGDYVWYDKNKDGKQDSNEKGIADVKVILTYSNGNSKVAITDSKGKYLFDNLMPGSYTITVDKDTLPKDIQETYELDGTLDNKVYVSLAEGQFKDDVDFGYYLPDPVVIKLASVGDYVWYDKNGNGKQESKEKGMPNVKVTLTDSKGNVKTTITDINGRYLFDNLTPGEYTISIDKDTLPKDMKETYELDKVLDNNVSVMLLEGQFKDDVDFGYNKGGINIDDEEVPGSPTDPNSPNEPKNPNNPSDKPNKNNEGNLPNTGTNDFNLLLIGVVGLTLSGMFILIRKRKERYK
jgi:uncharacterized repeat protein (TIGR01451 family)/LPXTG-motif cell wall-anchored protein